MTGESAQPARGSVASADIDNDGWLDLLVTANGAPPSHVFHNEAGATFTDLAIPLPNPGNGAGSGVWGDFDANGSVFLHPHLLHEVRNPGAITALSGTASRKSRHAEPASDG